MTVIYLPGVDAGHRSLELRPPLELSDRPQHYTSRVAFAVAHLVADWRSDDTGGRPAMIDWDATLGIRRHLFRHGLGVAEATDATRRSRGLDWVTIQELVRRSADQAHEFGVRIAAGVGTDHRDDLVSLADVSRAYEEQLVFVECTGSQAVVLPSRQLAAIAHHADEYVEVYDALLKQAQGPVILQWPARQADQELNGYRGSAASEHAVETLLELVAANASRIDGVVVPALGPDGEADLRSRLPDGVRHFTGDNIHYPELIKGDGTHHSHALLEAFAAVASPAAAALAALDREDIDTYDREMDRTLLLSRQIFRPAAFHETGIAFLSWLCGYQDGFTMVAGMQSARSTLNLIRIFELANDAQLFPDPDLAADRLLSWFDVAGVRL